MSGISRTLPESIQYVDHGMNIVECAGCGATWPARDYEDAAAHECPDRESTDTNHEGDGR